MTTPTPAPRRTTTPRRIPERPSRTDELVLTAEGRDLLADRARQLREVVLPELRPHLVARERDERDVADFERLSAEAERLEHVVATGTVAAVPTDRRVHLGTRVHIELPDGERSWVRPVHAVEAFLDDERVSLASPLSQALLGARAGDVVPVAGPAGDWSCRVLEVTNRRGPSRPEACAPSPA